MDAVEARLDAIEARLSVLEANAKQVTNVYSEGGSTGVYPESGSGAGVYVSKC